MLAEVRLVPLMVNELGPATVFIQTFPNDVSAVTVITGVNAIVVKEFCAP